jgi:hypothetical protein
VVIDKPLEAKLTPKKNAETVKSHSLNLFFSFLLYEASRLNIFILLFICFNCLSLTHSLSHSIFLFLKRYRTVYYLISKGSSQFVCCRCFFFFFFLVLLYPFFSSTEFFGCIFFFFAMSSVFFTVWSSYFFNWPGASFLCFGYATKHFF